MKNIVFRASCAFVVLLMLSSCTTMRVDGDAVACNKCRAMWIYLFAGSPAPGLYLFDEKESARRTCPHCQKIAVRFFESGVLLRRCPECGGALHRRPVNVVR